MVPELSSISRLTQVISAEDRTVSAVRKALERSRRERSRRPGSRTKKVLVIVMPMIVIRVIVVAVAVVHDKFSWSVIFN